MKISTCITVFNEEESIKELLDSILAGSRVPDEIVIVDGGSSDNTINIIKGFKSKKIKLFTKKGSIAVGRNESIRRASGEIVVLTDAGCTAKKDWLKNITKDFADKRVGMVAGFYEMATTSPMQKAASVYLGVPPKRFNKNTFLPSARSVAFRKKIWKEIGGFDESLQYAGEDTKFFFDVVRLGHKIARAKNAVVVWNELQTMKLSKIIWKFYVYAKGDGEIGIWWHPGKRMSSHNIKISTIYIRYFVAFILLVLTILKFVNPIFFVALSCLYLYFPIHKWRDVVKDLPTRLWLPVIQISSDMAVMAGFLAGTMKVRGKI